MGLHQFLDDGQANAGAAVLAGARLFTPIETLENKGQVFFSYFSTSVGKNDLSLIWRGFSGDQGDPT